MLSSVLCPVTAVVWSLFWWPDPGTFQWCYPGRSENGKTTVDQTQIDDDDDDDGDDDDDHDDDDNEVFMMVTMSMMIIMMMVMSMILIMMIIVMIMVMRMKGSPPSQTRVPPSSVAGVSISEGCLPRSSVVSLAPESCSQRGLG